MQARPLLAALSLAVVSMPAAPQQVTCTDTMPVFATTSDKAVCDGDVCTVTIDWSKPPVNRTLRIESTDSKPGRITPKTRLVVDNRRFNFLRYNLQLEVKEKTVDTYVLLEKLWRQIFVITGLPTGALVQGGGFVGALFDWRGSLAKANDDLSKYLNDRAPKKIGLTDAELKAVCDERAVMQAALNELSTKRDAAIAALKTSDRIENLAVFDSVDHAHFDFRSRVEAFVEEERMIREGFRKTIPQKDVGRVVTVTLKPTSVNAAAEEKPIAVEYFVQSELPVTYHVGLVYSRLGDVKFQAVRTVSGSDLFAKVKDDKDVEALGAFLSAHLTDLGSHHPLLASIGTDFTNPGKRLYAGITIGVWKGFVTIGAASATVSKGGNKVLDQIVDRAGNLLQTRELFDTVRSRRKWSGVFAMTVKPF